MLLECILEQLKTHLVNVEEIYPQDLRNGNGRVGSLAGKYPHAERGQVLARDGRTGYQ